MVIEDYVSHNFLLLRHIRERKNFRLPAIIPIVLYNGRDSWTAGRRFRNYQIDGEVFGEFIIDFKYHLVDVRRYESEYLQSMG